MRRTTNQTAPQPKANKGLFRFGADPRNEAKAKQQIGQIEEDFVAGIEDEVLRGERDMANSHPHLTSPIPYSPQQLAIISAMDTHEAGTDGITQIGIGLVVEDPSLRELSSDNLYGPSEPAA